jgi:hypothetical protein
MRELSRSLTLLNDGVIYLLEDAVANRKLIGHYIDVLEYPDGRTRQLSPRTNPKSSYACQR